MNKLTKEQIDLIIDILNRDIKFSTIRDNWYERDDYQEKIQKMQDIVNILEGTNEPF